MDTSAPLGSEGLNRLRWRCRRGMLENDLFLDHFLHAHGPGLTVGEADVVMALMNLGDNDLLDLCLGRRRLAEVDAELDRPDVAAVLDKMIRKPLKGSP
jgi:antitoxin CptB